MHAVYRKEFARRKKITRCGTIESDRKRQARVKTIRISPFPLISHSAYGGVMLKNSHMGGALEAEPGKVLTPSPSRVNRSVF